MVPFICKQVEHEDSLKYKAQENNAMCFFLIPLKI